jgi:hypothetical protein
MSQITNSTRPSLVAKLAAVMAEVTRIPKRGRNQHFGYDFATEADVADAIRGELADRKVMLFTEITSLTREEIGRTSSGVPKVLTTAHLLMTFVDGESDERIASTWCGQGLDSEDKGIYKALTGGEKYFLLKTFLVATGDDPDEAPDASGRRNAASVVEKKAVPKAEKKAVPKAEKKPNPEKNPEPAPKPPVDRPRGVITEPQRKRLFALITASGRTTEVVKVWLEATFGWTSSTQITQDRYDEVCEAIEAPGPLQLQTRREPGEEG